MKLRCSVAAGLGDPHIARPRFARVPVYRCAETRSDLSSDISENLAKERRSTQINEEKKKKKDEPPRVSSHWSKQLGAMEIDFVRLYVPTSRLPMPSFFPFPRFLHRVVSWPSAAGLRLYRFPVMPFGLLSLL